MKPEMKSCVGNLNTDDTIMSYSMTFGHVVTVSATLDAERGVWEFVGTLDGMGVIYGEVPGGKWRAARYLKFIRNGILSNIMRHKVNPAKKLKVESEVRNDGRA